MAPSSKKLLLLSTGGTIASLPGEDGLAPALGAEELVRFVPHLLLNYDFDCNSILNIDSSNMQPEEWRIIADSIYENYNSYDGFVITHGTDTMAYTSSMLSFMLRGLKKPVVLTGAQIPVNQPLSDAAKNVYDAFTVASSDIHGGVYVVFNGEIILGCRASKVRTTSFNAFESINYNYIGYVVNNKIFFTGSFPSAAKAGELWLADADNPSPIGEQLPVKDHRIDENVFLLKMIPGTRPEFFDWFSRMDYRGLVIEAFGNGGLHHIRRDIPEKLKMLVEKNISIVITSQCTYENADLTKYETGRRANVENAIAVNDMTTESAVTKLMWVLGHSRSPAEIKRLMLTSLCGEILV